MYQSLANPSVGAFFLAYFNIAMYTEAVNSQSLIASWVSSSPLLSKLKYSSKSSRLLDLRSGSPSAISNVHFHLSLSGSLSVFLTLANADYKTLSRSKSTGWHTIGRSLRLLRKLTNKSDDPLEKYTPPLDLIISRLRPWISLALSLIRVSGMKY